LAAKATFPAAGGLGGLDGQPAGKRIDYIFCLGPWAADSPKITDARVVLDQPSPEGIFASDHCGVLIDATLHHRND
jgi:endonuclease/exonuclease/phosphatase family metal-dependent hydrolase